MALEARLAVTQPYHGLGGELVHDVGELLVPGDAPEDVRGHLVIEDVPDILDAPEPPAPKAAAKGTAAS